MPDGVGPPPAADSAPAVEGDVLLAEAPVPEDLAPEPAATVALPETAAEAELEQGNGVYWIFVVFGLLFVVGGWFLPWFVEFFSNGIGESPQDVVSTFPPEGPASFIVYVMGVCMVAMLVAAVADVVALRFHRGAPFRLERWRALLCVVGAICPLVIWVLIGVYREEGLFGPLSPGASADNAIWMTMWGFGVLAFASAFRPLILRHADLVFGIVFLLFGALFPFIFSNVNATALIDWAAGAAAIYTLLALGLNVVVGFAGLLDLGYAAFFAIGAYTAGSLASPRHGLYLPFWVIIFIAAAVAALFGAILGAPTLRLRGDYLAIVTLGFGEIIPDAANNNLGGQTGGPNGITGIHHPGLPGLGGIHTGTGRFLGYDFGINPKPYFWTLLVVITVVVLLLRNLQRSRLGRAWVAIREDEVAAAATGINTVSTKLLAFAIGASVSGLAGAFYGAQLGVVTPEDFNFAVSVTALSTVVLGGIGTNTGAAVGGVVVSFVIFWVLPHLKEWMGTLGSTSPYSSIPGVSNLTTVDYSRYTYVVYGLILISIMLLRPGGLIPSRARKVELQAGGESTPLAAVEGRA